MRYKFSDLYYDDTKNAKKLKSSEYKNVGKHIIVDQGKALIAGYTDNEDGLYTDVPAIIFGDHTRNIKYIDSPFFLGADGTKVLKSSLKNVNYKYLYYLLKNASIPDTGYNRHFKWLKELIFKYHSQEQQNQIVTILDKLDLTITKYREELSLLEELAKARFVEMFGDPVINDKKWPTVSVENLCDEIYGGGTPSKAHEEYYENGDIPWVSSKDMKTDVVTDSQIKINQLGIENSTARLVPVNSVIMVIRSGILEHTLPVAINAVPITVNQDLKVFVPGNKITSRFLAAQFKMQEKSILFGVRAVTADNIEFNSLKARRMIVPPLELQNQFASFVEEVDKSRLLNICLKSLVESVLKIRIFSEYKKSS